MTRPNALVYGFSPLVAAVTMSFGSAEARADHYRTSCGSRYSEVQYVPGYSSRTIAYETEPVIYVEPFRRHRVIYYRRHARPRVRYYQPAYRTYARRPVFLRAGRSHHHRGYGIDLRVGRRHHRGHRGTASFHFGR